MREKTAESILNNFHGSHFLERYNQTTSKQGLIALFKVFPGKASKLGLTESILNLKKSEISTFFANRYRLKNRGPGVMFDEKF